MTTPQVAKNTKPKNTAGATVLSVTKGDNLIQADLTYYITFTASLPDLALSGKGAIPYIWVYSEQIEETLGRPYSWVVKAKGRSGKGFVLPVAKAGQYRLYLREPKTFNKIGDSFKTPFHIGADMYDNIFKPDDNQCSVADWYPASISSNMCNTSSYSVQPLFTINVIEKNNGLEIKTLFPIEYKGRLTAKQNNLKYPVANKVYQLTNKHTLKKPFNLGSYSITFQLWGDACQTYGRQHPYILKSPFSQALKSLYGGGVIFQNNSSRGFSLSFNDGTQLRSLKIQEDATDNASIINSFKSDKKMGGLEAIRKTHPSVFEYWFSVMKELNMTTSTISGAWRPKQGSILHRYSLGLDINKFTANVINASTQRATSVEVFLNRAYSSCAPVKISEITSATAVTKVLTTKLLAHIAKDTISSTRTFSFINTIYTAPSASPLLGWLGAPWARSYKDLGLGQQLTEVIHTDEIHEHHVHLTLKDDLT